MIKCRARWSGLWKPEPNPSWVASELLVLSDIHFTHKDLFRLFADSGNGLDLDVKLGMFQFEGQESYRRAADGSICINEELPDYWAVSNQYPIYVSDSTFEKLKNLEN